MRRPIIAQVEVHNTNYVSAEMVKQLDDLLFYARSGRTAEEIMGYLGIKTKQEIYLTLNFFGFNIAQLRADEIASIMKERPKWTRREIANHLSITLSALNNQIHYNRKKKK